MAYLNEHQTPAGAHLLIILALGRVITRPDYLAQGPGVPGATSNILFYGWAAPLAPGVEDQIMTAVHSLLKY